MRYFYTSLLCWQLTRSFLCHLFTRTFEIQLVRVLFFDIDNICVELFWTFAKTESNGKMPMHFYLFSNSEDLEELVISIPTSFT